MNLYKRHRFPPQIIQHAVWLYFVGFPFDELSSSGKITYGLIEFADGNIAMSPMPVNSCIIREFLNTPGIDLNSFFIVAEVGGSPALPYQ